MNKEGMRKLAIVTIFALAMAFLESAVVLYIRKLFYDGGFSFPLRGFTESSVLNIEWIREFFTIVMLLAVAYLAGKKFYERFAWFIYAFAVWDIFYYIWLKVILHWPASFFTWDVLFLIPWAWVSPVLAPVIVSVTFIVFALIILRVVYKGKNVKMDRIDWALFGTGMLLVLYTFIIDYGRLVFNNPDLIASYVPTSYNWIGFAFGEIFAVCAIARVWMKNR
jgi:hypothetical protein